MPLVPGFMCLMCRALIPEAADAGRRAGCCCVGVLPSGTAAGWQEELSVGIWSQCVQSSC